LLAARYARATLAAGSEQRAFLLNFPKPNLAELESVSAQWNNAGSDYALTVEGLSEAVKVEVDGSRLSLKWENLPLEFVKEE
jgi:hypothetical protein